ncbi:DUF6418 domain-containing protein [Microbacterium sp. NPDC096154]|uniref:DUF6418 domain-containing protein n=1 Tax=Microbacterium sp. NPDC096154 TaxID=3155549 RepID=UPI003329CEE1
MTMPTVLVLAALLALGLLNQIAGPTLVVAWGAVAVLVAYIVVLFFRDLVSLFLAVPFFAVLLPVVLSNLYIEHGGYISEQGVHGEPTGSTLRIVGYCIVFFATIQFVVSQVAARIPRASVDVDRFALWAKLVHGAVLLGSLGVLVIFGSPFLEGIDRFDYWSQLPGLLDRIPFLIALCCAATAVAIALRDKLDWVLLALLAVSVIILVLFAEKFTGLYTALVYSVGVAYTARIRFVNPSIKLGPLLIGGSLAAVALAALATVGFMVFHGYNTSNVLQKLLDRALGLQGHVWYGVDRLLQTQGPSGDLTHLLPGREGDWGGVTLLMYEISPTAFVDRMVANGLRFTMGGPGLISYVFGYGAGAVVFAVAGLMAGAVLGYLLFAIARLRTISLLVGLYGVRLMINVFMLGDVTDLWKPLSFAFWGWVAIDLLLVRLGRSRRDSALATA